MKVPGSRRLVPRFALTTLVVFVAVAVSLWWVLATIIRERTESTAQEHAEFVAHSVIDPALSKIDLESPVGPGDPSYVELRDLIVSDVLEVQFPVVRVKVWSSDGAVLFSDEPRLVGRRFTQPPGLRSAFTGQIFDRFYQVDSSSTRRHGGVGLGLHLVKTVTEEAGGAIDVQSEPGQGTRFTLRLPASDSVGEQQSGSKGNPPFSEALQRASMI